MPFPQQNPLAFTRANIENLNPNQLGCYGLYIQGEWIYIGRGDIRQRLLDHLNGDNDLITYAAPTHFVTAVSANPEALERDLIRECNPRCNRKVG